MKNLVIHDQTKENFNVAQRTGTFYTQKLMDHKLLSDNDNIQIWLEKDGLDYVCKLEVRQDNHSPLFFKKLSKKPNDAIRESINQLQQTLSNRDQIWKSKSHSSNAERINHHIQ